MDIWNFIKPFIEEYDAMVFTMKEFVPWNIKAGCLYTIALQGKRCETIIF
ncbi:hypothetical protein [Candidatus Kuenenia sp.]